MEIRALVASISVAALVLIAGCSSDTPDSLSAPETGIEQPTDEQSNDESHSATESEGFNEDIVDEEPVAESFPDSSLVEADGGYLVPDRIGEFVLVTSEMWREVGLTCSGFGPPRFREADEHNHASVRMYYTNNWDHALAQTECARSADYMLELSISDHLSEQEAASAISEDAALAENEESVRPGAYYAGPDGSYCYNAARPMCYVQAEHYVLLGFPYAPETLFGSRENATEMTADYVVQFKKNLGY